MTDYKTYYITPYATTFSTSSGLFLRSGSTEHLTGAICGENLSSERFSPPTSSSAYLEGGGGVERRALPFL
jgi:hypothetical protein